MGKRFPFFLNLFSNFTIVNLNYLSNKLFNEKIGLLLRKF